MQNQKLMVIRLILLTLATTTVLAETNQCDSDSSDACAENLRPHRLPRACKDFSIVAGNLDSASAVVFAEHHDHGLDTMKCMLALMHTMSASGFTIYFEGADVISKEQVLKKISEFKKPGMYVSEEGKMIDAICSKAKKCGSWDSQDDYETTGKFMHSSIEAFTIEKEVLPYLMKNTGLSNKKILSHLQSLSDQVLNLGSYLDEVGSKLRKNIIQKVIDTQKRTKTTFFDAAVLVLNEIKKSLSPVCENTSVGNLASCLQQKTLGGSSFEKRNDRLEQLVRKAESNNQKQISFFRAGKSHADSRTWGAKTAKLTHNSLRMGGGR